MPVDEYAAGKCISMPLVAILHCPVAAVLCTRITASKWVIRRIRRRDPSSTGQSGVRNGVGRCQHRNSAIKPVFCSSCASLHEMTVMIVLRTFPNESAANGGRKSPEEKRLQPGNGVLLARRSGASLSFNTIGRWRCRATFTRCNGTQIAPSRSVAQQQRYWRYS